MPMGKEKERVELKPVDESSDEDSRLYRLLKNTVEEVDNLPPVRVGGKLPPEARLKTVGKDEFKIRSIEPGVASLIERDTQDQEKLEEEWEVSSPAKGIPWGWLALIGCAFAGGILWSLLEVNRSDERSEGLVAEAEGILEKEREEELEAEKMIATLERTVENFFDSRSVDELLRYVRHPERVKPFVENYYSTTDLAPLRVESIISYDPLTLDNLATFWMILCELSDGSKGQLLVEALSGDTAKVDWETFVCYQPMEWDKFAKDRSGGYTGDFRVYVELDSFYTHEFSDSDYYVAFRLTTLNSEEVLYGYVDRRTMLAKRMNKLIAENRGAPAPMILQLEVPENVLSKRGVLVKKLLCARWVYIESPEVEQ
ncbi:MAG: hypothetical protein IZT59_09230 [Verrucomicrobia bacterium]|nr:hypothetical protein [Verrucomicrobiota bacterium]|tara:strand:+ start:66989 stop:68101 length:1113 start_codon:yes stop_codon:yes gene_type:complete